MKYKVLTSLVIYGLFISTLNAYTFSSVADFDAHNTVITGENIVINGGSAHDIYSLSHLRQIAGSDIEIHIAGTAATLSVDNSFRSNNVFGTTIVMEHNSTNIRFDEDFLYGLSGELDDLVRFTFPIDDDKIAFVYEENDSGMFVYDFGTCTNGHDTCIYRRYSAAYLAEHQESLGLTGISSIVQYAPQVLLRPVSTINQHELFDVYNFTDDYFVSVVPEYYNARDFNDMGLRLNAGTKVTGRLFVGASAYLSTANFKYGVDDFYYAVYGGNLRFLYELNDLMFVRGVGGLSVAKIKSDVANNTNVFSSYAGADLGAKFGFESGLYLSPFVGFGTTNAHVLGVHDNVYLLHTGTDVGFKYFLDGVTYSYNLRAGVNTGGYMDASVGIGAWTVADKIGGGVSIGVVDTEFGWSGKFSANVRFAF